MNPVKNDLITKLESQQAVIGVIGLGYVGLPLALRFSDAGYSVIGFDIDPSKVSKLNKGKSYISHIPHHRVEQSRNNGFIPSCDFSEVENVDGVILCLPTPLGENQIPNLDYLINTTETICPYLRRGQVVSLESTTYPGTTEEEIRPRIADLGLVVGEEIFLVYSPEREDPGNADFDTSNIPKICGGVTSDCLEVGLALYAKAINQLVPVSSTRVAEMTKLLENIYRAVNISMVNEMKMVADKMDIDLYEVIEAAKTKPFGFAPFYPGPGLGGHCLPIDPFYLSWKARQHGVDSGFIHLAGEVNTSMPHWIMTKLKQGLQQLNLELSDSKVLVAGIAYKKNIDDTRESPAVAIMELLKHEVAELAYSDPYVPIFPVMRNHSFDLQSVEINTDSLSHYDVVMIITDHDVFDYELILQQAKLVVDTRGRYTYQQAHNLISA